MWCTRRRRRAGWSPSTAGSTPFVGRRRSAMTNTGSQWRNLIHESQAHLFSYRYLKDFFTSMIELSWSWTLFSFAASFFISWLGFAVAWYTSQFHLHFVLNSEQCKVLSLHSPCFQTRYIVVLTHGDLRDDLEDDHVVCIRPDLWFNTQ